ncbi:hypothetical protein ABLB69_09350 [Xenorhabdus khoisanae]|uniref:hypothetical protein n=1 Tax=Xenorhabdus khoisanae TaxID=880157 RepID=UPI0032B73714
MTLFDQIDPSSHLSKFPAERKRLLDYLKITEDSKQCLRARNLHRGTIFFPVPRIIGFVEGDYEMITPEMLRR